MASLILVALTVLMFVFYAYKWSSYKPPGFPPGPPRIPIFGAYALMLLLNWNHLHKAADRLCKYYKTNIIGLYIGPYLSVITNDFKSVKEALTDLDADGRNPLQIIRIRDPKEIPRGLFFIDGDTWKEQRRFSLRQMRDFGFGRRFESLELEIKDEMSSFFDIVKNGPKYEHEMDVFKGGLINCPYAFFGMFGNCLLKVIFNERIPREDQAEIYKAGKSGLHFQRNGDDYGRMFSILEWTRYIFPNLSGFNDVKKGNDGIYKFIQNIIDSHIQSYEEGHIRGFIDIYIQRMKEDERNGVDSTFIYDQLVMVCLDYLFPSLTALGTTVTLLIQRLIENPEAMQRMQNEIDDVVGQGRWPDLDDRINLPYTEAAIREGMRIDTLVPSGVPHRAIKDMTLQGYAIPQNTVIITGLTGLHYDDSVFTDPYKFDPERFLDQRQRLSLKKDVSLPFGAGKRLCAGETFARNALFLFVTALLQKCNIQVPDEHKVPQSKNNMTGIIITPQDCWLKLNLR